MKQTLHGGPHDGREIDNPIGSSTVSATLIVPATKQVFRHVYVSHGEFDLSTPPTDLYFYRTEKWVDSLVPGVQGDWYPVEDVA